MRILFFSLASLFLIPVFTMAQGDNCTNPKVITVCPSLLIMDSTKLYTNDRSSWTGWGSTLGNDVVYEVNVPAGSNSLLVSIFNASKPLYMFSTNNNCSGNYTYGTYVSSGSSNIRFPVSGTGPFYIWIDHNNTTDITYSISFGLLETATWVVTPDTRGNFGPSPGTACPGLTLSKQTAYADILWNGVHQNIVSYTPLNAPGVVTSRIQLKNTLGQEGPKQFTFKFDPALANPTPTVTSMPGFYNTGTWVSSVAGNLITWTFVSADGTPWGDFNGIPNSCLVYEFSFNITPTSNVPSLTNVNTQIYKDKRGSPFSGYVYTGCCAAGTNCPLTAGSNSSSSGGSFGFSFNDPVLPVKLISFNAASQGLYTILHWETATEHNSDRFEIEFSTDGIHFITIGSVPAGGNSNDILSYQYTDAENTNYSIGYYRLKEVDSDGSFFYSKLVSINKEDVLKVYPNPAKAELFLESISSVRNATIYDQMGRPVMKLNDSMQGKTRIEVGNLTPGIYFLLLEAGGKNITKKIMIE
jgi:hypothetical protein